MGGMRPPAEPPPRRGAPPHRWLRWVHGAIGVVLAAAGLAGLDFAVAANCGTGTFSGAFCDSARGTLLPLGLVGTVAGGLLLVCTVRLRRPQRWPRWGLAGLDACGFMVACLGIADAARTWTQRMRLHQETGDALGLAAVMAVAAAAFLALAVQVLRLGATATQNQPTTHS